MQALLGELFPWIVGLYVLDGLAQLGRGHLLLAGGPGRLRMLGAGIHLVGLSPLGEAVAAHDLPFLKGRGRLFLFDPRRRTEPALVSAVDLEAVPREALGEVERVGRKLRAAGRLLLVAPTPPWAERLRADLASFSAGAEAGSRPEPIAALDAALDAARRLRGRQRAFTGPMRAAAALLFVGAFVVWPVAAYAPSAFEIPAGPLLAALGLLVLLVAALAGAMLAACGEKAARSLGGALHLALYPVAALRPLVHASRSLYRRFDAPTIVAALLPPEAFAAWAAREIRRARLSMAAAPSDLAPAWEERARDLGRLLVATGVKEEEALRPPTRAGEAAAWCPLCTSQYRPGFERCGECGVALEPFSPGRDHGRLRRARGEREAP